MPLKRFHVESSPGPDEHENRKCEGRPCAVQCCVLDRGAEAPGYFMCMLMGEKLIYGGLKSTQLGTKHHKETLWEGGSVS